MTHRFSTILLTIVLTAIGSIPSVAAQDDDKQIDLEDLYQQIDQAIEQFPEFVAEQEERINDSRKQFLSKPVGEDKLQMAEQLFNLYRSYKNDSALHYARICISLADSLHRPDLVGRYLSQEARLCSNVGMYVESLALLQEVNKSALDRQGLTKYYEAWMHVCGEIGSHSQLNDVRQAYYELQDTYRDSVLKVAETDSEEYLHLKMDVLNARQLYQDALKVSNRWLNRVLEGTHEDAFAAFYSSVVYDKLTNHDQVRYWLGRSALDDIRCAVLDQAALVMLAEHLCEDGDIERAYRYASFSRDCNTTFYPHLRDYQVSSVINVINKHAQEKQYTHRYLMIWATVMTLLLLIALLCIFLLLRRRK